MLFVDVVLPVALIAGTGALITRWKDIDTSTISWLLLYVFNPVLMFSVILANPLTSSDFGMMTLFTFIFLLLNMGLGWSLCRAAGLDQGTTEGVMVATSMTNSANVGASVSLFAFGEEGFITALVFMAITFFITSAVAIYIMAKNQGGRLEGLKILAKQPLFYAAALAVILRLLHVVPPAFIMGPINLVKDATIPLALLLLGIQLTRLQFNRSDITALGIIGILRLALVPALSFVVLQVLGISGLVGKVLWIQSAMPTAINAVIYASEFEGRADLISAGVLVTTLLAAISVTVVLSFV